MEEYWDRFVTTGKIEDYLYYKGMRICEETVSYTHLRAHET